MSKLLFIKKHYFELLLFLILLFMYHVYFINWFSNWINPDSNYAFGLFMFAFIGFLIKNKYKEMSGSLKSPSVYGIILALLGLFLFVLGVRTDIEYLVCMSLPLFIGGIVTGIYGIKILRMLLFPLILFAFTLPILPVQRVTMPMQFLSAKLTVEFLNILGLPAFNDGSIINVFNYKLSVEAACSGFRSLISLFFTSVIFAYFIQSSKIKKFIFILISIPLSLIMNIFRLTLVSFYATYNGYKGLQEFHDFLGLVVFVLALCIMIFISKLIEEKEEKISYEV